jgi:hypothetical protein
MELEYRELDDGIRLIKLIGRLDMEGTARVDQEFVQRCAGENVFVLVDLSRMSLPRQLPIEEDGWLFSIRNRLSNMFWK